MLDFLTELQNTGVYVILLNQSSTILHRQSPNNFKNSQNKRNELRWSQFSV